MVKVSEALNWSKYSLHRKGILVEIGKEGREECESVKAISQRPNSNNLQRQHSFIRAANRVSRGSRVILMSRAIILIRVSFSDSSISK